MEIWKKIDGFENYEVSNLGRVKSLQRWSGTKFYKREQIMKLYQNKKNGYIYVSLSKDNKAKNIRVHILVAKSFIQNPNNYLQVNHIDGDKTNNNVSNLEWCDCSQNIVDMYKRKGIYENDEKIINDYMKIKSCKEVAKIYKCSSENIRCVLKRNNIQRNGRWNNERKTKENN